MGHNKSIAGGETAGPLEEAAGAMASSFGKAAAKVMFWVDVRWGGIFGGTVLRRCGAAAVGGAAASAAAGGAANPSRRGTVAGGIGGATAASVAANAVANAWFVAACCCRRRRFAMTRFVGIMVVLFLFFMTE